MKNNFTLFIVAFFCTATLLAQSSFKLSPTTYVGALSNDASKDWTLGWTNWTPKTTVYPSVTDTTTLNGMLSTLAIPGEKDINGTLTLDPSKVYLLKGFVVVRSGGVLNIPAGTLVRASADLSTTPKNYATIVVERGGKLNISGTQANPVVFTSAKDVNVRDRGDWGGILIAGNSYHNLVTSSNKVQMEGFNNVSFDPNLAFFGGSDPLDNSGTISYLRIEFGGIAFEANKEINGLTLGAVGSGTELSYVQVSYSGDDSFEWFGGTINSNHLIAYKGTDDDFDTDNGYSGISQFGIGVRDSAYYDLTYWAPSGGSTSEGFESDNEATGTANVRPLTKAVFSNYTMIGPVPVGSSWSQMNATTKAAFRRGARIRRNSALKIVNSIFMGYRNFLMIDGDSCLNRTNSPAILAQTNHSSIDDAAEQIGFNNNLIVNTSNAFNTANDSTANGLIEISKPVLLGTIGKLAAADAWVKSTGPLANNINPVDFIFGTVLVNPLSASPSPDFRPVSGSPALTGANFTDNPILKNLVTSTKEIKEALGKISIYPNPVHGGKIHFEKVVDSYGLFDLNGKLIIHGINENAADINGLAPGIYIIKIEGVCQKINIQ